MDNPLESKFLNSLNCEETKKHACSYNEQKIGYGFYCVSLESETKEEAVKTFLDDLKTKLHWIRGYKYWRTKPDIQLQTVFDDGRHYFLVAARITAFEDELPKAKEIDFGETRDLLEHLCRE